MDLVARAENRVRAGFTAERAVYVLTFVLFLNYVDRGIITGASTDIKGCLASHDLCSDAGAPASCPGEGNRTDSCELCRVCGDWCNRERVEQTGFGINTTRLGLLQSMFMVGYVAGAVGFAQLASRVRPFRLISLGLVLWVIASLGSGAAGWLCEPDGRDLCPAFYLMLAMRALSGVGEASMNTLTLPFLDDVLPAGTKGYYLGIYYAAIPVGTAVGFIWAGLVTELTGGAWQWAFVLQAPVMVPFALLAYVTPFGLESSGPDGHDADCGTTPGGETDRGTGADAPLLPAPTRSEDRQSAHAPQAPISLWENVYACLSRPAFVLGCLGYAVYTGVVAGLGFYGPQFIQNYRPCDENWDIGQAKADVIFGMVISSSGLVGTVIGGALTDRLKASSTTGRKGRRPLLRQLLLQLVAGLLISYVSISMVRPEPFFVLLWLGSVCIFMVSAGINMVLVWSVPPANRPMSGALSVLAIHLFGDVPSPVLIGWISDHRSPLFTLTLTVSALVLALAFWAVAYAVPDVAPVIEGDTADDEGVGDASSACA